MLSLGDESSTKLFVCVALAIITLVAGLDCPRCVDNECQVTGSCDKGCIAGFSGEKCDVAQPSCYFDWTEHDGMCYKVPNRKEQYLVMLQVCKVDLDGTVVKILNKEKDEFVMNEIKKVFSYDKARNYWTAVNDIKKESKYVWDEETEVAPYLPLSRRVKYISPRHLAYLDCVMGNWEKKEWHVSRCTDKLPFMCERHKDCPVGFFGDDCLSHCKTCNGKRCHRKTGACEGGCPHGYRGEFCTEPCEEGTFGAGCANVCETQCMCNHLNGSCVEGKCMHGWSGNDCEISHQICPPGWKKFDRSCYLGVSKPKSWKDAVSYCKGISAELVKIRNAATHTFLSKTYKATLPQYWIGLNDIKRERNFVWTDGEEMTYSNFDRGEPNNYFSREDCVLVSETRWRDSNCSTKKKFICENNKFVCIPGVWGDKCATFCGHCIGGSCDSFNGYCKENCEEGWTGKSCNETCPFPTYGEECAFTCDNCKDSCHSVFGHCLEGCVDGYKGEYCTEIDIKLEEEPDYIHSNALEGLSENLDRIFMDSGSSRIEWRQFIVYSFFSFVVLTLQI